jgi:hypothetical protein
VALIATVGRYAPGWQAEAVSASSTDAVRATLLAEGSRGGVVWIHHMPGYDRETKEFVRRLAVAGYHTVAPNLYSAEAPGAAPADAAADARAAGGVRDVDHPVHAPYGHTVNIDVINPSLGPAARVALERTEESALALGLDELGAIRTAIAHAPAGLASMDQQVDS